MKRIELTTVDYNGKYAGIIDIWRPNGSVQIDETGIHIGRFVEQPGFGSYVEGLQICTGRDLGTITIS